MGIELAIAGQLATPDLDYLKDQAIIDSGVTMAILLSSEAIQSKLTQLPDWSLSGKTITCTRTFKDFIAAVDFVNRLVEPAEASGHHPDLSISYNRVVIQLTTHDAGGLTEKDFALAETISKID